MEEGAGATANPSLTPEPPPEASAGMLHAGRGFIGNAGITLIGAGTGALLTMGADVLAARFLGVSIRVGAHAGEEWRDHCRVRRAA
jgi:hypothetical protein